MARLTDAEHAQNALARKKRTRAVLEREIAALEELLGTLARTEEMRVKRDGKQPGGEIRS